MTAHTSEILCDGCGQPASPEHIARRLQRLEWATRYRPIHLHTLLLGAISPQAPADFLYSPEETHSGEAANLIAAAGISAAGKSADAIQSELQRRGIYLTHVLECPLDVPSSGVDFLNNALITRLPTLFTRIRRSLKPKRLAFISGSLTPSIERFASAQLNCELALDDGRAFALDNSNPAAATAAIARFQDVLAVSASR
ncbi:MAG TPA: hypothetical protein VN974_06890 [Candidatus Dormibacteraeota bacterium]|nr:hypothetical protein [Candidatus Dormibacteraeota bacterium]